MDGIKAIMEEQIDKALEKDVKVHVCHYNFSSLP